MPTVLLSKKKAQQIYKEKYEVPYISGYVKPTGKFWKRLFNKKVRQGGVHKRMNWIEWC